MCLCGFWASLSELLAFPQVLTVCFLFRIKADLLSLLILQQRSQFLLDLHRFSFWVSGPVSRILAPVWTHPCHLYCGLCAQGQCIWSIYWSSRSRKRTSFAYLGASNSTFRLVAAPSLACVPITTLLQLFPSRGSQEWWSFWWVTSHLERNSYGMLDKSGYCLYVDPWGSAGRKYDRTSEFVVSFLYHCTDRSRSGRSPPCYCLWFFCGFLDSKSWWLASAALS